MPRADGVRCGGSARLWEDLATATAYELDPEVSKAFFGTEVRECLERHGWANDVPSPPPATLRGWRGLQVYRTNQVTRSTLRSDPDLPCETLATAMSPCAEGGYDGPSADVLKRSLVARRGSPAAVP